MIYPRVDGGRSHVSVVMLCSRFVYAHNERQKLVDDR